MGRSRLQSDDYPSGPPDGIGELTADGWTWRFQHVQVGNPQCSIAVADEHELAGLDLPAIGPAIEHHELFPNRTNVSWYAVLGPDGIRARIFERGVGETSASGTGAIGAAVAYVLGGGESPVTVRARRRGAGGRGGGGPGHQPDRLGGAGDPRDAWPTN